VLTGFGHKYTGYAGIVAHGECVMNEVKVLTVKVFTLFTGIHVYVSRVHTVCEHHW